MGSFGNRTRTWFNHNFRGGGKRSAPLFKGRDWRRKQLLTVLKKDGKDFIGEQVVTRQRRRAELRREYAKKFAAEYPGEPRRIRRSMAFAIAKKIYRGMREEERKAA